MGALSSSSWVYVILLFICMSAYLHRKFGPYKFGQPQTQGPVQQFPFVCVLADRSFFFAIHSLSLARVSGLWWKAARVGERLSPYVAVCCVLMALHTLYS